MNRRLLLIIVAGLILVIVAFLTVREVLRYHKVTISYGDQISEVVIFINDVNADIPKVATKITTSGGSATLKEGYYTYSAVGKNVASQSTPFTVSGETSVTVPTNYSDSYLASLSSQEQPQVQQAIVRDYPKAMQVYELNNIKVLKDGNWAVSTLSKIGSDNNNPAPVYRAVLHKDNGSWRVVSKPQLVATIYNTPDVDMSILSAANELSLR